ncbi:MAG: tetratricopeptide repeat protein [Ignavibacteriaceae bacterium]|jgi:tetratricopeptide (TPR) repeat protein|nr:tetratricopeptide repeat protein [Ignavibacteriaceae bacterium]MCW8814044.1 tetratricopeptide repeat protein [Chlorobium sp.]
MKNSNLFVFGMLLLGIIFLGFQCSSTELNSAKLYIQQKNWDKALEALKADVEKNPKSDEGYYLLGTVYSEMDRTEEMIEAFDNSLAISNKFADKINEYRAYQWANNYNRGVSLFQRGNNTADKDSSKMYYDMAIDAYKKATILEPDSGLTYRNLAFVYLTTNQTEESIEPLKKLIELEKAEEGYQYLGEVYYTLGLNKMSEFKNDGNKEDSIKAMDYYNKGIMTLEEGLKLYPDNSEMLNASTNSYIGAGRINEAITSAKALVEKEPDNAVYHYNYGVLLLNVEKYQDAETQLLKAIELDPNYENAIYNIAVTYVKWGTAINKEAEAQGVLSEDYKQKYQKALPYLEKVVELDAKNPQMWELIGKVYSVLGMNDDANNAFKKADELR